MTISVQSRKRPGLTCPIAVNGFWTTWSSSAASIWTRSLDPVSRPVPRRASRGCEGAAPRTVPREAESAETGGSRAGRRRDAPCPAHGLRASGRSAGSSTQASSGSRSTSSRTSSRTSSGSRRGLVAPSVVERCLDRVPQRRLLADLAHGATPRVHVRRRLPDDVAADVVETVAAGRLPAMGSPRKARKPGRGPRRRSPPAARGGRPR